MKIGAVKVTMGVSNVSGVISTVFVRVGRFDKEYVHTNAQVQRDATQGSLFITLQVHSTLCSTTWPS